MNKYFLFKFVSFLKSEIFKEKVRRAVSPRTDLLNYDTKHNLTNTVHTQCLLL